MIQQAYEYVSSSLWRHLMFFMLKITNRLKLSRWRLEKSELPWELNFYSRFYSFMEFYVIHLKNQGVKFWS